jgi:hypothetical protein
VQALWGAVPLRLPRGQADALTPFVPSVVHNGPNKQQRPNLAAGALLDRVSRD